MAATVLATVSDADLAAAAAAAPAIGVEIWKVTEEVLSPLGSATTVYVPTVASVRVPEECGAHSAQISAPSGR